MFANLKNKLIEEVKASPSKFQQFANAAQAAVSSSSSSATPSTDSNNTNVTNENFFSITEEDTPQNSPFRPQKLPPGSSLRGRGSMQSLNNGSGGAIPRTRKLSNSSMASDISFRLPSYDAPAVYHLQSDYEASGSEMDDTASTARLDVITKEQLYDAYKKSLDRYHKYRCRYTDLAKKYKDLEHDSSKARSVLVETQEKAIRRISELREQCTLEQQAKAHLEEALRMEMDDMNCKMQAYQTKLSLLGENPESVSEQTHTTTLIDLSESESNEKKVATTTTANNTVDIDNSELHQKVTSLEKQLAESIKQLSDLNEKYETATSTIESLRKREEENVLLLAQTKQAIHTELEQKENEVKQLKNKLKVLETNLESVNKKEKHVSEEKYQLLQSAKHESDAKVIATEHMLNQLKAELSVKDHNLTKLEEEIKTIKSDNAQSIEEMRQQNQRLNEMLQRNQQIEISLAEVDNELNQSKNDNVNLRAELAESERKIRDMESALQTEKETLLKLKNEEKSNDDELKSNYEQQTRKVEELKEEIRLLNENISHSETETITALKTELEEIRKQRDTDISDKVKQEVEHKDKELKAATNKLNKQKKHNEQQQTKHNELNVEMEKLKLELAERDNKLERAKQIENEKQELQERVTSILQEIGIMQNHMQQVQKSHSELEQEKRELETKIENMLRQQEDVNFDSERARELWQNWEQRAQAAESKLEVIVCENTKLAERNCLLEEQSNHLEKQLVERERQQVSEEADISEMRVKLQTSEDNLEKLNEKMKQVLDENSRLHNAQELMDHDYRTLQDKNDALEKEKLIVEDNLKCIKETLQSNNEQKSALEKQVENLSRDKQATANEVAQFEVERNNLQEQLNSFKITCTEDQDQQKILLEEAQQQNIQLQNELINITEHFQTLQNNVELLERSKEEVLLLSEQRDSLEVELEAQKANINDLQTTIRAFENDAQTLDMLREELQEKSKILTEKELTIETLQAHLEASEQKFREFDSYKTTHDNLTTELTTLQTSHAAALKELAEAKSREQQLNAVLETNKIDQGSQLQILEEKCRTLNTDVEKLHESNDALQLEIDTLNDKHELQVNELQQALSDRETQLKNHSEAAKKLIAYEQMQIENEYLNKHTKQLERELAGANDATKATNIETAELREKLKSLQCELYVLQGNAEQHARQIAEKDSYFEATSSEVNKLKESLEEKINELTRQTEHTGFITQQNDTIQNELLQAQQQLADTMQQLQQANNDLLKHDDDGDAKLKTLEQQNESLHAENTRNSETIETLNKEVNKINEELQTKTKQVDALQIELAENRQIQKTENDQQKLSAPPSVDAEHLRTINEQLQSELEDIKFKSGGENRNLRQEIEELQMNNKQMAERIMELEQLRAGLQAQKLLLTMPAPDQQQQQRKDFTQAELDEKVELELKLKDIMNEVQDVTNRNLFLEQKCENYLILEQSNERLKLQNAKISRQLDETLVSMQHSEGISANTEFEYLKNIMFQYLTGNTNNETLVKVISAVLKFSPQQTQVALEKEHQRRSLLNKIL